MGQPSALQQSLPGILLILCYVRKAGLNGSLLTKSISHPLVYELQHFNVKKEDSKNELQQLNVSKAHGNISLNDQALC